MLNPIQILKNEAEEAKRQWQELRQDPQRQAAIQAGERAKREIDDARRRHDELQGAVSVLEQAAQNAMRSGKVAD